MPLFKSFRRRGRIGGIRESSPILLAEVTEVVKKLMVDKIHPEVLSALDVVELPWLAHLFNIAWESGTGPCGGCVGSFVYLFF